MIERTGIGKPFAVVRPGRGMVRVEIREGIAFLIVKPEGGGEFSIELDTAAATAIALDLLRVPGNLLDMFQFDTSFGFSHDEFDMYCAAKDWTLDLGNETQPTLRQILDSAAAHAAKADHDSV
jgi:hypothetical protein